MTLQASPRQPFAAFRAGEPRVSRDGQRTGFTEALIYQVEDGPAAGQVCVMWRSTVMPAPAFDYFPTLAQAWGMFQRVRERSAQPEQQQVGVRL